MGGEWLRQYDERGNLIASTDPLGHTTLYEVDALGQVTAIIDALGKRKTLEWDEAGNLIAYTDCSRHTTRYTYDALGHLRSGTDALEPETDLPVRRAGQLLQVTQPDGARTTTPGTAKATSSAMWTRWVRPPPGSTTAPVRR